MTGKLMKQECVKIIAGGVGKCSHPVASQLLDQAYIMVDEIPP